MTEIEIPEKCLKYILYSYELQGRMFLSLVETLVKRYGEEVKETIRQAAYENGVRLGQKMARKIGKNSLEEFVKAWDELWGFAGPPVEISENKVVYRGSSCAAFEAWKEMGLDMNTISNFADLYCINDVGFARGFNPKLELTHTKRLMKGDSYCEWVIELKE